MKDEIKEINIKIPGQILDYVDTKDHLLDLFNYITNLQQEKDTYKEQLRITHKDLEHYISRCEKAIDKLTIKQARFINEKDYLLDDNDLDEIMYILQNGSDSQ